MRCSEVRAKIVEKIRSITPDTKTSDQDIFKVVDIGYREFQGGAGRTCTVLVGIPPTRANMHLPQDLYTATFEMMVSYSDYPTVTDRIGDDGEKISQALESLPGENADIVQVGLTGSGVEELEGHINAIYSINVDYTLDSGV